MTINKTELIDETSGPVKIPNIKDNFGLTQSEFKMYVTKLAEGDESLFTKIFKEHFHESVTHLSFKFKISKNEAYDSCMDTMLEFRAKVLSGKIKYGNLRFLFTRMALNNYILGLRKNRQVDDAIEVFVKHYNIDGVDQESFLKVLEESVVQQSKKNIDFLKTAFYSKIDLATYAERNGLNYATLRKQKQRTLSKLKNSFFEILKREKLL